MKTAPAPLKGVYQVAQEVGVSHQTIRNWIAEGANHAVPAFDLNGQLAFTPAQVERIVEAHRRKHQPS